MTGPPGGSERVVRRREPGEDTSYPDDARSAHGSSSAPRAPAGRLPSLRVVLLVLLVLAIVTITAYGMTVDPRPGAIETIDVSPGDDRLVVVEERIGGYAVTAEVDGDLAVDVEYAEVGDG